MHMADVVLASSILERLRDLAQNISNGYEFEANFTSEMGELFRRVGEDGLCFIRNSLSSPHYSSIQLMFHQGSVEHLKERQRSKELTPLSRAISLLDLAAALWVDDCDLNFKDAMWNNYSVAYEEMFKEVKTLESLEAAIRASQQASKRMSSSSPWLDFTVRTVGWLEYQKHIMKQRASVPYREFSLDSSSLDAAIENHRVLLSRLAASDPHYKVVWQQFVKMHVSLCNFSSRLEDQFWDYENVDTLNRAIEVGKAAAVVLGNVSKFDRGAVCENLSNVYKSRYQHLGYFSDLVQALEYAKLSLENPTAHKNTRGRRLSSYAQLLSYRSIFLNETDQFNIAIKFLETRLVLPLSKPRPTPQPESEPAPLNRPFQRVLRMTSQAALIETSGTSNNTIANVGIEVRKPLPRSDTPAEPARSLSLMSVIYQNVYQRRRMDGTGLKYLDQAVDYARRAVQSIGEYDPFLSGAFTELAQALLERYVARESPEDLDLAVSANCSALDLASSTDSQRFTPTKAARFMRLDIGTAAKLLEARYLRYGDIRDLDNSINSALLALQLVHKGHPRRAVYVDSWREKLLLKVNSIAMSSGGARIKNIAQRIWYLIETNAMNWKSTRADQQHMLTEIMSIAKRGRLQPVHIRRNPYILVPQESRQISSHLYSGALPSPANLPLSISPAAFQSLSGLSFFRNQNPKSMVHQPSDFRSLPTDRDTHSGEPHLRIETNAEKINTLILAREWAALHTTLKDILSQSARIEFPLLPLVERDRLIRSFSRHVLLLASLTLQFEKNAYKALLVAESGRELLNKHSSAMRSDRGDAKGHIGNILEVVERVLVQMRNTPLGGGLTGEYRASHFVNRSSDLLRTLESLSKSQEFMRTFDAGDYMFLAKDGPIITLIATEIRSDAIVVTESAVRAVSLENLLYKDAVEMREDLRHHLVLSEQRPRMLGRATRCLQRVLQWLWDVIVKPIIDVLDLPGDVAEEELPRLRWICCGVLSHFPVHAAGNYTDPGKPSLHNYAVSSYLSSITVALAQRDKVKRPLTKNEKPTIFIIDMPTTPKMSGYEFADLNTEDEFQAIRSNSSQVFLHNRNKLPRAGSAKLFLGQCAIAHFSCHGVTHDTDPWQSSLVLTDHDRYPLTVSTISALNIEASAHLAFLSACHSANNFEVDLSDEVVHLARAFQLAGFPSVVGTMWQAYDDCAVKISEHFYKYISSKVGDGKELNGELFARGLHHALGEYRKLDAWQSAKWASWIHLG